jgi:sugar lactone lactonase YvrE
VLLDGLGIPESLRWHDGRLWFCNWLTGDIVATDLSGHREVVAHLDTTIPYSIDWLPDGTLLAVSGQEALVLALQPDGTWRVHADLNALGAVFNEIVVARDGSAYVNGSTIALVRPDGSSTQVADGIAFGNGMAITPDGRTLIVAESHGACLTAFAIAADGMLHSRRVWADTAGDAPDGICVDADGAVWYASVPGRHCVRVREGGEVLQVVDADRPCYSCALGDPSAAVLFVGAAEFHGMDDLRTSLGTGRILTAPVGP